MEIPINVIEQVKKNSEEEIKKRKQSLSDKRKSETGVTKENVGKKGILLLFLSDYKYKDAKTKTYPVRYGLISLNGTKMLSGSAISEPFQACGWNSQYLCPR